MSVALKKLDGVESVAVRLGDGVAAIKLKPGSRTTLDQVRDIVKKNGFTAKEATVTVAGKVIERNGKPALEVSGSDLVLLLAQARGGSFRVESVARESGNQVVLSGVVREPKGANEPEVLEVDSLSIDHAADRKTR